MVQKVNNADVNLASNNAGCIWQPALQAGTKCSKGQTGKKKRIKEQPTLSNLDLLFF